MLKPGQKRPSTPSKSRADSTPSPDAEAEAHWRQGVRETVLTTSSDGTLNFGIKGGSDNGEFACVCDISQDNVNYVSGKLEEEDIILEIQGQKVAGYTQRDVVAWLNHCCRNGNPVVLKTVSAGTITQDVRQFLNTRFQKGSIDHDLQNTIRDNLYLRTVPVTTRTPREGEVNGVDYTFLTPEEFMALERSGNLLESGVYEGNHYGTPKPSKEPPVSLPHSSGSNGTLNSGVSLGGFFPGAHPSSEGKRKRNRSNVEAMASKSVDPDPVKSEVLNNEGTSGDDVQFLGNFPKSSADIQYIGSYPKPGTGDPQYIGNFKRSGSSDIPYIGKISPPSYLQAGEYPESPRSDLGPLPPNWEKAYTERGEVYFIDHNSGTSHWLDPRLSKFQKKSLEDCLDDELPYGWEKIDDPHYGTYYIDHVNRRTQYENPVIQAKRAAQGNSVASGSGEINPVAYPTYIKPGPSGTNHSGNTKRTNNFERPFFTRNPTELRGERIQTTLVKSSRGLGFTIVGGDDTEEEFLQIKSVVPNGPAWLDGKLQMGDVLVYVNDTCVLGFTHHDMVSMFQSIAPGETVSLEVCRGYPLPFDPNDPNTEVVTTVAVNAPDAADNSMFIERDANLRNENYNLMNVSSETANIHNGSDDMVNSSVKSMPDLCSSEKVKNIQRPSSTDLLLSDSSGNTLGLGEFLDATPGKTEFLTIPIVKGPVGFGFTIADSAYGQKVKKILDRQRCKSLIEGDILVEINTINVRNMSHSEVVQVLKECSRNQEAMVTVQRGGGASPLKNKPKKKEEPGNSRKNIFKDSVPGLYRSKTPTADLYSTQQKEVIPNRPKTPLVDTRSRPKTPTSSSQRPWTPSESSGVEFSHSDHAKSNVNQFGRNKSSGISENGANKVAVPQSPTSPTSPYDTYKGSFSYSGPYNTSVRDFKSPISAISDQLGSTNLQDNHSRGEYSRSRSPGNEIEIITIDDDPVQKDHWNRSQGQCEYKTGDSFSENVQSPSVFDQNIVDANQTNNRSPSTDYFGSYVSHPYYNGYSGTYEHGYGGYGESRPAGFQSQKDYGYSHQNSGYNSQSQNILAGSATLPGSGGYYASDSLTRRKESTSFEHEQPLPSTVTRFPRDVRCIGLGPGVRVYPAGPGMEWAETSVTLLRQEAGFGFRIVGGTEEGSQVSIGHIVPGGAADLDGRLCTGDEIITVDGQSVLSTSHHHVVQLMGKAASNGGVTLGIRRKISTQDIQNCPRSDVGYPFDVTVSRRESEGFGFVIISSINRAGSTIGRIIEGSPAERCGQLHVGDRILAVNHINIMSLHHGDIVNLIKDSGYSVTLTIGPPVDDASSTASASQREEDIMEEEQYHAVELTRGTRGFGFSIRGGREFQNMPLFVLQIAEYGPAAADGRLRVGDQIIEINGVNTKSMTHADAIEIIRNGGPTVRLLVRRGGKVPPAVEQVVTSPTGSVSSPSGLPMNLRPGSSLSQPSGGTLALNGPVRHSSPHDPGYWERYAPS